MDRTSLALVVALLLTAPVLAAAEGGALRLNLATPAEGTTVSTLVDLVEVRGEAGIVTEARGAHDVVMAIDASPSAHFASGLDLDGDGVTGVMVAKHYRDFEKTHFTSWTSDADDVVLLAEIRTARALIDRLDPSQTRVALMTVSGSPELHASLGPPDAARAALDALEQPRLRYNTDLAQSIDLAVDALSGSNGRSGTRRTIVLLSDGRDTMSSSIAEAAQRALIARVRILAIALGPEEQRDTWLLRDLAKRTNGRYLALASPESLPEQLDLGLVGLESVEIENLSTGMTARAVRVFPNGAFDGFLQLLPGGNRLRVSAEMRDGRVIRAERSVIYAKPFDPTAEDQQAARELLRSLQLRALETERIEAPPRGEELERELVIETPESRSAIR